MRRNQEKILSKLNFRNIDKLTFIQYKNIAIIFICKTLYASISLLIIPLLIHELSAYQYGIFTTIVTATTWLSLFDGGISNGAKNKLTEVISLKNYNDAKEIISTVYITLFSISVVLILILF